MLKLFLGLAVAVLFSFTLPKPQPAPAEVGPGLIPTHGTAHTASSAAASIASPATEASATEAPATESPALPGSTATPSVVVVTPAPTIIGTATPSPVPFQYSSESEPEGMAQPEISQVAYRPPLYPVPWAPSPYDHFYFIRPVAADEIGWPVADYRYGGVFIPGVVHTGIDIPVHTGTPIQAAGPGRVTWAGYGLYFLEEDPEDPYGLAVAVRHDFGYQGDILYTVYGHLSELLVHKGQRVEAGDLIGLSGETGMTTGPHLHFEVRLSKNNFYGSRNPELWLAPPQGWGVLAARIMDGKGDLMEGHTVNLRSYETGEYFAVNTYEVGSTNSDPYYRENLVLGDLPAGKYEVWVKYEEIIYDLDIRIQPGRVSYFTFRGQNGFRTNPPADPAGKFIPPELPATPASP